MENCFVRYLRKIGRVCGALIIKTVETLQQSIIPEMGFNTLLAGENDRDEFSLWVAKQSILAIESSMEYLFWV